MRLPGIHAFVFRPIIDLNESDGLDWESVD